VSDSGFYGREYPRGVSRQNAAGVPWLPATDGGIRRGKHVEGSKCRGAGTVAENNQVVARSEVHFAFFFRAEFKAVQRRFPDDEGNEGDVLSTDCNCTHREAAREDHRFASLFVSIACALCRHLV